MLRLLGQLYSPPLRLEALQETRGHHLPEIFFSEKGTILFFVCLDGIYCLLFLLVFCCFFQFRWFLFSLDDILDLVVGDVFFPGFVFCLCVFFWFFLRCVPSKIPPTASSSTSLEIPQKLVRPSSGRTGRLGTAYLWVHLPRLLPRPTEGCFLVVFMYLKTSNKHPLVGAGIYSTHLRCFVTCVLWLEGSAFGAGPNLPGDQLRCLEIFCFLLGRNHIGCGSNRNHRKTTPRAPPTLRDGKERSSEGAEHEVEPPEMNEKTSSPECQALQGAMSANIMLSIDTWDLITDPCH